MAVQTTANIKALINFTSFDLNSLSKTSEIASVGSNTSLSEPSGNQSVNAIYHAELTLGSGQSHAINLQSLTRDLFGISSPLSFINLKGIVIANLNEDVGDDFLVQISGSDRISDFFNGGSGEERISPLSSFFRSRPLDGFTIDASHKVIVLKDLGEGATCDIIFAGNSG